MGRGARPVKAKVEARSTVTRKLRKVDASTSLQLKQRLAEALAQHAAISEILQVIASSPMDTQPVFEAVIIASAAAIAAAKLGHDTRAAAAEIFPPLAVAVAEDGLALALAAATSRRRR